jgi:biotin transporter BioY
MFQNKKSFNQKQTHTIKQLRIKLFTIGLMYCCGISVLATMSFTANTSLTTGHVFGIKDSVIDSPLFHKNDWPSLE